MADIDPAWEYYAPDPEVEEAVYGRRARGLDLLYDPQSLAGGNWGFRLGRGDPNRLACLRLAREKPGRVAAAPRQPSRCLRCGELFSARKGQVYCSRQCGAGGASRLPGEGHCQQCGLVFRPIRHGHRFCSRACAVESGATVTRREVPDDFAAVYLGGASTKDMEARFGAKKWMLQRWRRRLGLPARPTGRPAGQGVVSRKALPAGAPAAVGR